MAKYIRVPLTAEMENDYRECAEMMDSGQEKDCVECSMNRGSCFGCLGEYPWRMDDGCNPVGNAPEEKGAITMTENEAIRILGDTTLLSPVGQAAFRAIECMRELQKYQEIGTVKECREAVEKQKAKKPDYEGDGYADGYLVYDTWICPNCGKKYEVDYDDYKHCPNCGQAIDGNLEEMENE